MLDKQNLEAREKLKGGKLGAMSRTGCENTPTLMGITRLKSHVIAY